MALGLVLALGGCAQVPPQSVELSATIGRDVTEIEKSHLALIDVLFDGYENRANKVIDELYTPYYIRKSLEKHRDRLVQAIDAAARPGSSADDAKRVTGLLQIFLEEAHREIEDYRKELLDPLRAQRRELRERVSAAYRRVHEANTATTGYLASLARITDVQNSLLAKLGLPDLQTKIGVAGEKFSADLDGVLAAGREGSADLEKLVKRFEELMDQWKKK